MPPLPPPGPVIRCGLQHTIGSDLNAETRFYIGYSSSAPSAANLSSMAAEIGTLWGSHLSGLASTAVYLTTVTCQDLATTSGNVGVNDGDEEGSRTGQLLAASSCVTVDYLIARHYRGGKPRGFWPFGVQGDLATSQTWDATLLNAVNSNFGAFMAALLAYSGDTITKTNHVNVSWYQGVNPPTTLPSGRVKQSAKLRTTPVVDAITTHLARAVVGSQRRRLTS